MVGHEHLHQRGRLVGKDLTEADTQHRKKGAQKNEINDAES
jgi:hypothetical protein